MASPCSRSTPPTHATAPARTRTSIACSRSSPAAKRCASTSSQRAEQQAGNDAARRCAACSCIASMSAGAYRIAVLPAHAVTHLPVFDAIDDGLGRHPYGAPSPLPPSRRSRCCRCATARRKGLRESCRGVVTRSC
ncbi:hypothetical protein EMIT0111MI5_180016 [Burkholderia sp. IT-111MI5]